LSSENDYTKRIKVTCPLNEVLFVSRFKGEITLDWSCPGEEDFHISMSLEDAKELSYYLNELISKTDNFSSYKGV